MRKTVAELMSVDFVAVSSRMRLNEALAMLVASEASELCVLDGTGRLEGIVTDYELLKASMCGDLHERLVSAYVSRAVAILPAHMDIEQSVPLFRDGVCSRAYVCRAGQLLGRLTRTAVLRYLSEKHPTNSSPVRPLSLITADGRTTPVSPRVESTRAPQPLATSVLGGVGT